MNVTRLSKYGLVAPSIALIVSLTIFPVLYLLWISFLDWDLQRAGRQFIGLANYVHGLQDRRMWEALGHTLFIVVVAVAAELVLGLVLAEALAGPLPAKKVIIPFLILPVIMSPIVAGYGWRMLWDTQYGPINQLLGWLVGHPVTLVWLINSKTVYFSLIVTEVWQWTPFMFLLLLAALSAVDPSQLEAAAIDGAGYWRTFWRIVLPAIWPVMAVAILIRGLDLFRLFDIVWVMTRAGPGTMTETLSIFTYVKGFQQFETSYTAAVALFIIVGLSVVVTLALRRVELSR